jgi:hypothetical protein
MHSSSISDTKAAQGGIVVHNDASPVDELHRTVLREFILIVCPACKE